MYLPFLGAPEKEGSRLFHTTRSLTLYPEAVARAGPEEAVFILLSALLRTGAGAHLASEYVLDTQADDSDF